MSWFNPGIPKRKYLKLERSSQNRWGTGIKKVNEAKEFDLIDKDWEVKTIPDRDDDDTDHNTDRDFDYSDE